jgi:hypothetical protein
LPSNIRLIVGGIVSVFLLLFVYISIYQSLNK